MVANVKRVALVTGTSSGIGTAVSRRLLADGYIVAGFDLNEGPADSCSKFYKGDITDRSAIRAAVADFVAEHGEIHTVVPCAAITMRGLLSALPDKKTSIGNTIPVLTEEQTDTMMDINVQGTMNVCRETVPHMAKGGSIVLFSSLSSLRPSTGLSAYCASKGAIDSLTLALAVELAPNVRVNAVQPGLVDTAIWTSAGLSESDWLRMKDHLKGSFLLERIGTPDDIANAIAFLSSDQASWITGVLLPVCGGGHLK